MDISDVIPSALEHLSKERTNRTQHWEDFYNSRVEPAEATSLRISAQPTSLRFLNRTCPVMVAIRVLTKRLTHSLDLTVLMIIFTRSTDF